MVDASVNADTIIESQTGVQGEAMEVFPGVQVHRPIFAILVHVLDGDGAFQVNKGHIALDGRAVQGSGGHLATTLARFIPWRCADGETLAARDNAVESVESGSGDEGGLVGDPEVLDRIKGVGKNDASVPQTGLEDWPAVFLGPSRRHSCMVLSEL